MTRQPAPHLRFPSALLFLLLPLILVAVHAPPASAAGAVALGYSGAGVWPEPASANSNRWFRGVVTWTASSESILNLYLSVDGSRTIQICNNGVWAPNSAGVSVYATAVGGEFRPDPRDVTIGEVVVTVGPYVGYDIWGSWHGAGRDGAWDVLNPNAAVNADNTAYGQLRNWSGPGGRANFSFSGTYATWETQSGVKVSINDVDPIPTVSGTYVAVPDDDDILQWYSGEAAGIDPFYVDGNQPDHENGSGSSVYTFRVRYRSGYHTRSEYNIRPRFNRDEEPIPGPVGNRVNGRPFTGLIGESGDGGHDPWVLGRTDDPWFDHTGYWGTWFSVPSVCLIIDKDYAHPHYMVQEDPNDTTYNNGVIYRYTLQPTNYKSLFNNLFMFPYDSVGEDPLDILNTATAGQPHANNYAVLSVGGHVYEFIASDDFTPHLGWAWCNIGRPGNSEMYAYIRKHNDGVGFSEPQYSPHDAVSPLAQRFVDTGAGGFGYPYDSQDTTRYPKINPLLTAHPYFPHRTATSNPYPNGWGGMNGYWRDGEITGPDIPGALACPFDLSKDGGPMNALVEAGYRDPDVLPFFVPLVTGGKGESPRRFTNAGTIGPNLANIFPDDDPVAPLSGGKWTTDTKFTFRINYWQSDNVEPLLIQVLIRKATSPSAGGAWKAYTLAAADPTDRDVRDGKVFRVQISPSQLPSGGGAADYHYYFKASDGKETTIFPRRPGGATVSQVTARSNWISRVPDGGGSPVDPGSPGVPSGADWYWFRVNKAPVLSQQTVTPGSGRRNQNFVFRVNYKDTDLVADPNWTGAQNGDRPFRTYLNIDLFGDENGEASVAAVTGATTLRYALSNGTGFYADGSLAGLQLEVLSGQAVNRVLDVVNNVGDVITVAAGSNLAGMAAGDKIHFADWFRASMKPEDPNDANYTDGAWFVLDTSTFVNLGPGIHRYYFEFFDDWGGWLYPGDRNVSVEGQKVRYPLSGSFAGPEVFVNHAPTLNDFRYVPQARTADEFDGTSATFFTLYVTYTDQDNDPPTLLRLGVDGTAAKPDLILNMTQVDPNDRVYSDGAQFRSEPIRLAANAGTVADPRHFIRGQASDGELRYPVTPAAPDEIGWAGSPGRDKENGPKVAANKAPVLRYPADDNTPGNSPGLKPKVGRSADTFTYTVYYFDFDNYAGVKGNPPVSVEVYVDGVARAMTQTDPTDTDYTDGAKFTAQVTGLEVATPHTYYFLASDGNDLARLPTKSGTSENGPVVDEPPGAPLSLVATDHPGDQGGKIDLTWSPSPDDGGGARDVVSYRIYRRAAGDANYPAVPLGTVDATRATNYIYTDTTAVGGVQYFYVVTAVDRVGLESARSNEAGPVKAIDNNAPAPPTGLTATLTASADLKWNKSPDDKDGGDVTEYRVYRSTTTTFTGAPIGTVPATKAASYTFRDANMPFGHVYNYIVRAFDGTNESANSNMATVDFSDERIPPALSDFTPADGSTGVAPDVTIAFKLTDTGYGVDKDSIKVDISINGGAFANLPGNLVKTKVSTDHSVYSVTFKPTTAFNYGDKVAVRVAAADLRPTPPNAMTATRKFDIAAAPTFTISGRITDSTGKPGVGIEVKATPGTQKATTAADGTYTITGLLAGAYTVTPSKADHNFTPASRSVTVGPNATGVDFQFSAHPKRRFTFGAGTRLVAIPMDPDAPNPLVVFGGLPVARWNPTLPTPGYQSPVIGANNPFLNVGLGRGFFIKVPAGGVAFDVVGIPLNAGDPFTLTAERGWNMLGNPYAGVLPWANITIPSGSPVHNFAYIYDPGTGYQLVTSIAGIGTATSIPTNAGFWLLSAARANLAVRAPAGLSEVAAPAAEAQLAPGDYIIRIVARSEGTVDASSVAGVLKGSGGVAIPNPPAMASSVDVYFTSGDQALACSVADAATGKMTWDFVVASDLVGARVELTLPDLSRVPADQTVTLTDLDAGKTLYARTLGSYSFTMGESGLRHFRLEVGSAGFGGLQISAVTASQASAGTANVSFVLSRAATVDVTVMNIAGRPVRTIASGAVAAEGVNLLSWDLRGATGTLAPAGRYLVRVEAVAEDGQRATALQTISIAR